MENKGMTTIQELINSLDKYPANFPVAMFQQELGYVSVAFKKECFTKNGQNYQWLDFFPNQERPMYDVKTLVGYLQRLPKQAFIGTKNAHGNYSPIYLAYDELEETDHVQRWLVMSDSDTYDHCFRELEESTKEQAFEKMLAEINSEHTESIEAIHSWLCKNATNALFKGILKADRTLSESMDYCLSKAKEQAENSSCAMVSDDTVYSWVADYFLLDTIEFPKVSGTVRTTHQQPKKAKTTKGEEVDGQVNLFEMV